MRFSKITLILTLFIFSCSDDPASSLGDFQGNGEFIISVVQGVSGIKLDYSELEAALKFSNLPTVIVNSEEINGFLSTGLSTNLEYYLSVAKTLHPIINNTTTNFIDPDTTGVTYSYNSGLGGGLYLFDHQILLSGETQYSQLVKADVAQTYRSAYIEIDIGVVSKLVSFLAENPENVVNNTGQLRVNYRVHTNRVEINYIYDVMLGGTEPYKAEGFGQLFNTGSGKMEWSVETGGVTTDNCWSWTTSGTLTSCLTN